ncbi:MAG: hypothetical protein ACT4PS_16380 [Betaproteobacteria bacterium]
MEARFKRHAIAMLLGPALVLPAVALQAAQSGNKEQQQVAAADKPSQQTVMQIIQSWKDTPKHAAKQMIDKYGVPNEATPTRLVWFNNGSWKRTVLHNVEIDHKFPMPHKDALEQVINYDVPADKVEALARFDGSVYVDRTRGEMSARCDMEPANILALNLAHEIVTGKRSVEDARAFYPKAVMAHLQKEPSPYTQKLAFTPPTKAGFSDKPVVSQAMIDKAEKLKQAMIAQDKQKGGIADRAPAAGGPAGKRGGAEPLAGEKSSAQGSATEGRTTGN